MERSEDYQAYLRQIVLEFEHLLKAGGKDMRESYSEIIESFYWAYMANKNNIIEGADRDQVLQSIRDLDCKAWTLKLKGRKTVDPASIEDNLLIGLQRASRYGFNEASRGIRNAGRRFSNKNTEQIKRIKDTIKNLCTSQVLAQWHVTWSVCQLRLR